MLSKLSPSFSSQNFPPQTLQTLHQVFTVEKIYSSVHTLADISHSHLAFVQIFKIFVYSKIIENIFQSDIYYRINSSVNLSFFCSISNICLQFLRMYLVSLYQNIHD